MARYIIAIAALITAALFVGTSTFAGDEKKFKAKCPVSGKDINKDCSVKYNGGKVYFCCPNCPAVFKKKTKKFAAKANHQLYGTEQAKIVKCPFTGRKLNPDTKISVEGVPVCFCCFKCQGKAKKLKGNAQINAIFNNKSFKKGFEVKK